jgi:general secretion pathway protein D
VGVRWGEAAVIGGLISNQKSTKDRGVPRCLFHAYTGILVRRDKQAGNRAKLVVVLTPRVIAIDQDGEAVTKDF